MKLVPDWKDLPRWHSTRVAAALAALPFAWSQLPDEFKALMPDWATGVMGAVLFIAFAVGRVVDQK